MSGKQNYNLKGFFYCPNQGKPLKSGRRTCHSMKPKNASIEANQNFFKEEQNYVLNHQKNGNCNSCSNNRYNSINISLC